MRSKRAERMPDIKIDISLKLLNGSKILYWREVYRKFSKIYGKYMDSANSDTEVITEVKRYTWKYWSRLGRILT